MVATSSPVGCRHPLSVNMKPKKPTQAELIQTLLAQVAELRGRLERLEQRPVAVVQYPPEPPESSARPWWQVWS